jgi:uncharacterized membrane protein
VSDVVVSERVAAVESSERSAVRRLTAARVLYAAAFGWTAAFGGLAVLHHVAFLSARYDLGNMVQAVWSTAHGHFLEVTSTGGGQFTRLGAHFDPILALFAPLWWVWPSPLLLVLVQAAALGSGALPVFWLARKHVLSETLAAWLAVAYLLYAPIQLLTVDDFHPVALGVPLLLFALWYLDEDRLGAFAVCAVLASLTGEEFPALVGWLGVWYILRRRRVRAGSVIAVAGIAVSVLAFYAVIPAFSPGSGLFASRYAEYGGSPAGIAGALVHRPLDVFATAFTGPHVIYVLLLTIPWAGLFLLEPVLALGAAPMLLLNLLSANEFQSSIGYHYTAPIVPFLVGASVFGAARLRPAVARHFGITVLALMTLGLVNCPFRLTGGWVADLRSPTRAAELDAVKLIPEGVPVSASNHLGARLSGRSRFLAFPVLGPAQWAAVDVHDGFLADKYAPRRFRADVARLRHDPHWKLVFERDGVLVLRRVRRGGPASLERTSER